MNTCNKTIMNARSKSIINTCNNNDVGNRLF